MTDNTTSELIDFGAVAILNVGAGDTKLTLDKNNPVERERAARIVTDMLKSGYALLVQVGEKEGEPLYQRATGFDPETCEYLLAGGPDERFDIGIEPTDASPPRKRRFPTFRVRAESTRAVSVGRTAGG